MGRGSPLISNFLLTCSFSRANRNLSATWIFQLPKFINCLLIVREPKDRGLVIQPFPLLVLFTQESVPDNDFVAESTPILIAAALVRSAISPERVLL